LANPAREGEQKVCRGRSGGIVIGGRIDSSGGCFHLGARGGLEMARRTNSYRTVYPRDWLSDEQRAETYSHHAALLDAAECARVEGRDGIEDFNEYVIATARALGIKIWPEYLSALYNAVMHS